jgi:hypothetical protein
MINLVSSPSVMTMSAGAILVLERPLQKFCSVDSIGLPFFRDTHTYCAACEHCQKLGRISRRNMMPLNPILIIEIFDV